jgi:hypothetical protein
MISSIGISLVAGDISSLISFCNSAESIHLSQLGNDSSEFQRVDETSFFCSFNGGIDSGIVCSGIFCETGEAGATSVLEIHFSQSGNHALAS